DPWHRGRRKANRSGRLQAGRVHREPERRPRRLSALRALLRAAIVVTGSELVRGDRPDLNRPYLAPSLLELGVAPAELRIVGDGGAAPPAPLRAGRPRRPL